jgi:hypothetical protein
VPERYFAPFAGTMTRYASTSANSQVIQDGFVLLPSVCGHLSKSCGNAQEGSACRRRAALNQRDLLWIECAEARLDIAILRAPCAIDPQ